MGSPQKENESKGFFAAMSSRFSVFSNAMHRSVNGYTLSLTFIPQFHLHKLQFIIPFLPIHVHAHICMRCLIID